MSERFIPSEFWRIGHGTILMVSRINVSGNPIALSDNDVGQMLDEKNRCIKSIEEYSMRLIGVPPRFSSNLMTRPLILPVKNSPRSARWIILTHNWFKMHEIKVHHGNCAEGRSVLTSGDADRADR